VFWVRVAKRTALIFAIGLALYGALARSLDRRRIYIRI
jgi:hypothetical protein